ncbi:MAG TPA: hypothetical protein PKA42_00945 [Candidatus Paceibacterota bacterium]|nr:hypothetical protein [Candidatus Paceibacterota bacterium]HMO82710.1 hypothetical protein [Candidatus Paceibacterota bacterium]
MPRLTNEENVTPEVVPRKRVARRTVTRKSVSAAASRGAASSVRRAPTSLPVARSSARPTKRYAILAAVMVVVVVGAALIGTSDSGVVDVQARIAEKEQNTGRANIDVSNENDGTDVVPVQNTPPVVPVSMLKGRSVGTAPATQTSPVVEEIGTEGETSSTTPEEQGGETEVEETGTEGEPAAEPAAPETVESDSTITTE